MSTAVASHRQRGGERRGRALWAHRGAAPQRRHPACDDREEAPSSHTRSMCTWLDFDESLMTPAVSPRHQHHAWRRLPPGEGRSRFV